MAQYPYPTLPLPPMTANCYSSSCQLLMFVEGLEDGTLVKCPRCKKESQYCTFCEVLYRSYQIHNTCTKTRKEAGAPTPLEVCINVPQPMKPILYGPPQCCPTSQALISFPLSLKQSNWPSRKRPSSNKEGNSPSDSKSNSESADGEDSEAKSPPTPISVKQTATQSYQAFPSLPPVTNFVEPLAMVNFAQYAALNSHLWPSQTPTHYHNPAVLYAHIPPEIQQHNVAAAANFETRFAVPKLPDMSTLASFTANSNTPPKIASPQTSPTQSKPSEHSTKSEVTTPRSTLQVTTELRDSDSKVTKTSERKHLSNETPPKAVYCRGIQSREIEAFAERDLKRCIDHWGYLRRRWRSHRCTVLFRPPEKIKLRSSPLDSKSYPDWPKNDKDKEILAAETESGANQDSHHTKLDDREQYTCKECLAEIENNLTPDVHPELFPESKNKTNSRMDF